MVVEGLSKILGMDRRNIEIEEVKGAADQIKLKDMSKRGTLGTAEKRAQGVVMEENNNCGQSNEEKTAAGYPEIRR